MTGTVLHSDNPDYPKGEEVVFGAQDNSNSSIFHFDIITPLFLSAFQCVTVRSIG